MSVPSLPASGLPTYLLSCPNCGAQLAPHVGPPQDAPWFCGNCARGWWCSELSSQARGLFRPRHCDFGHSGVIAHAVGLEFENALTRGHSVSPSMTNLPGVASALATFGKLRSA